MKHSILIIEDCKEILENLTEILILQHYSVSCASDGKTAIDIALGKKPDVILCDILMAEFPELIIL